MYSPTALASESDAIPDVQLKTSKTIKKGLQYFLCNVISKIQMPLLFT